MNGKEQKTFLEDWSNFILAILACILDSAFTHGYQLGIMQGIQEPVQDWLNSKNFSSGQNQTREQHKRGKSFIPFFDFIESCFGLGGFIGCFFLVMFADQFGRKGGMLMTTFISIFASICGGYSKYFDSSFLLLISRILYGIKHGINSGLAPMYMMEISPMGKRALFTTSYGLFISLGMLSSTFVTKKISNKYHWPLALSLPVIPAIFQLIFLPFCPESPKYLFVMKKNEWQCRKALKWLRGSRYKEEEVDDIRQEYNQRAVLGEIRLGFILKNRILRSALITSTILTVSDQLCGATILLKYVSYRYSTDQYVYHVFFLHFVKIVTSIVPFFIIERVPRKQLLLCSFTGMAITSFILCAFFEWINFPHKEEAVFAVKTIFLISYKMGCGVIYCFSPSEYFSTAAVSIAYSVGTGSNWFLKWCVSIFGVPFLNKLRGYSFLNYVVTNTVLVYYIYKKAPETRSKTIREIYKNIHSIIK